MNSFSKSFFRFVQNGWLPILLCNVGLSACKAPSSSGAATTSSNSSGNIAQYIFYQCRSATISNSDQLKYSTSFFNNTSAEISLQQSSAQAKEIQFSELSKSGRDEWKSNTGVIVRLTNKANGGKGIEVHDPRVGRTVSKENSNCELRCSGPTQQVDNHCLWSGKTDDDDIGNFIIETVATLGASSVLRMAQIGTARGVALVSDPALRTGAHLVAKAKNYDDAVAAMGKAIEKTNPLTGQKIMGKGNCANDAMTQLVSLALGRWACAIPYPQGHPEVASSARITADLAQLFGIRKQVHGIKNLSAFAQETMALEMKEGHLAVLLSGSKGAGHMTLVAKLKGQLVHINNQSWPVKFQSVTDWEKLWTSSYGKVNPAYTVFLIEKKILGF
jgi:hypothetical protein